jgi:hypothetical protein
MLKGLLEHVRTQIEPVANGVARVAVSMDLNQRFELLLDRLACPQDFVRLRQHPLYLDRMGVVRTPRSQAPGVLALELSEIEIATKGSRIGALVGFPRGELLPRKDLRQNAERFLAM